MKQRFLACLTIHAFRYAQPEHLGDVRDERPSGPGQLLHGRSDGFIAPLTAYPGQRAPVAVIEHKDAVLRAAALRTALAGLLTGCGRRLACWLPPPSLLRCRIPNQQPKIYIYTNISINDDSTPQGPQSRHRAP